MKALSLKIEDKILFEAEKILANIKQSRNSYINEAIDFYNRHQERLWLEKQYAYEAELLREDTQEILKEMDPLDPHLLDM